MESMKKKIFYAGDTHLRGLYGDVYEYLGETWKTTRFATGRSTWYSPDGWPQNGNSPIIATEFVVNPDGSVTLIGSDLEITAKEW
jgi:hypothetical protein